MKLKPDIYIKSVHDLKPSHIEGKKLLCFDLDNTLDKVDNLNPLLDLEIKKFFDDLERRGFVIYLFSNNKIKNRVSNFAKLYDVKFKESANKPFQKKYKTDPILNKYSKEEILFVGDKLITDVLGANLYGCDSVLVDPLEMKTTKWYSIVMQFADEGYEKIIRFKRGSYYES